MQLTHEQLIHAVVVSVAAGLNPQNKTTLERAKFVYGAGKPHLRGVTYYDRWKVGDSTWPLIEVCRGPRSGARFSLAARIFESGWSGCCGGSA